MNDDLLGPELDGLYHQSRKVKEQYETVALSLLTSFPLSGTEYIDFYFTLQLLYHYVARSDYALKLALTIKEALEQADEAASWRYGYCLLRIGLVCEALFRDDQNAILYLKMARDCLEKTAALAEERFKLAISYRALATIYCRIRWDKKVFISTSEIAHCLKNGEQLAQQLAQNGFSPTRIGIFQGTLYVWRSKYEVICDNLEQAELWINRAEANFIRHGYVNVMDQYAIFDMKALIHSVKQEYPEEIAYLKAAAAIHVDGFGEYHRLGIERALRLATAYQNNGQPDEAAKVLTHYLKIAEEMLGNDAALTATIRKQLQELTRI